MCTCGSVVSVPDETPWFDRDSVIGVILFGGINHLILNPAVGHPPERSGGILTRFGKILRKTRAAGGELRSKVYKSLINILGGKTFKQGDRYEFL
jgi:hypothetical protein